jgi:hypothetical protein
MSILDLAGCATRLTGLAAAAETSLDDPAADRQHITEALLAGVWALVRDMRHAAQYAACPLCADDTLTPTDHQAASAA